MLDTQRIKKLAIVRMHVVDKLQMAVLVSLVYSASVFAQDMPVHWLHVGAMPPGAIGHQRVMP